MKGQLSAECPGPLSSGAWLPCYRRTPPTPSGGPCSCYRPHSPLSTLHPRLALRGGAGLTRPAQPSPQLVPPHGGGVPWVYTVTLFCFHGVAGSGIFLGVESHSV